MASYVRVVLAITLLAAVASSTLATDFVVGDEQGWNVGLDYQAWAQGTEFHVGDRLDLWWMQCLGTRKEHITFTNQVDEAAFIQCAPPTTSVPLTSGDDAIELSQPGNNYYLCGIDHHCATGNLKLMITVLPQVPAPPNFLPQVSDPPIIFPRLPVPPNNLPHVVPAPPDNFPQVPNPPYNWPHFSAAGYAGFDYLAWIVVAACGFAMASSVGVVLAITLLAAVATSAMAVDLAKDHDKDWFIARTLDFVVGDDKGWTIGLDYQAWAKPKEFHVGDRLVFNYPNGEHNVYQVNETAFKQCVPSAGSTALTTGNDVVTLTTTGSYFFLCGIGQHCKAGNQKLAITVLPGVPVSPPSNSNSNIPTISAASFARFNYLAWMIVACGAFMMIAV
ncbi:hypothetical protein RJ639_010654 [Escallonia herrerae]|uniref:Phytocyanin domain-containing protein n=1 Tax=Escallonia herrerae TaxID=1293975 RepID=A0AA88VRL0_9ASTE|nr:hypothetical protein RJ639_010654 [Escallonia herrerae]